MKNPKNILKNTKFQEFLSRVIIYLFIACIAILLLWLVPRYAGYCKIYNAKIDKKVTYILKEKPLVIKASY